MKFVIFAMGFAGALAAPSTAVRSRAICPNGLLYSVPQCCTTGLLGLADLDCKSPLTTPINSITFHAICAAQGAKAACCSIPVAGLALLCENP
ncbi:hypothetical protein CDD80_6586 [Ophiocordyceps camponoti-rufipedis]|uniref:Hydrophobin n=1 Tax=Ophiocordyceps camponoti-rufipedis TaxID=2004952 RepID=A0A2C5Z9S0_9HYPO|nr:hypothetical protein CDD80_6586 [Ophiocordyceps camponoti-rufipedis]